MAEGWYTTDLVVDRGVVITDRTAGGQMGAPVGHLALSGFVRGC